MTATTKPLFHSNSVVSQSDKSISALSTIKNHAHHGSHSDTQPIYSSFLKHNTNVLVSKSKVSPNIWNNLVPSGLTYSLYPDKRSSTPELHVTNLFRDPHVGAKELLSKCGISSHSISLDQYKEALEHLEQTFTLFKNVITEVYGDTVDYKAKLIASRGSDGKKCPKFHIDNVPVRLILSLEGPGVCYLKKTDNSHQKQSDKMRSLFQVVNLSLETDTARANRAILNEHENFQEVQAETGEIVLLMGKKWEKNERHLSGAFHKSPEISGLQGRVLLTVDANLADEFDIEEDSGYIIPDKKKECDCEHC